MFFLVDECTGPLVARWLRNEGHDVFSVFDEARGLDDEAILDLAWKENRILITSDKDFGELVFREKRPHHGVVLIRLNNYNPANQMAALAKVLIAYGEQLVDRFVVVTEGGIRLVGS